MITSKSIEHTEESREYRYTLRNDIQIKIVVTLMEVYIAVYMPSSRICSITIDLIEFKKNPSIGPMLYDAIMAKMR